MEALRAMPEGTVHVREQTDRRILVQKAGSEIQLLFDSTDSCEVQSRFDLDSPLDLKSPYTRAAMLALLWRCPPRRVHVVGLGGGRIPMVLRHHFPDAVIDCTEVDPEVTDLAVRYFGVRLDAHLRVFHEDGRGYLERRAAAEPYDVIVVDAFIGLGFGEQRLATLEFLQSCGRQLGRDGVLVLNLLPGDPLLDRKLATFKAAFPQAHLCEDDGVTVVFGHLGEPAGRDELMRRARRLQREHRFAFSLQAVARALGPLPQRYRESEGGGRTPLLRD